MKWAESDKRILKNPISHLKRFNVAVDRRHDRRALSDDELIRLIRVTSEQGKTFEYCTGKERALIYKVSALTGLRRNEISSLTKGSFDLDSSTPTVRVEAAFSKHRREDILPLTEDLIPDLRIHLSGKEANEKAFRVPKQPSIIIQEDLKNAGIPYKTSQGYADFHSLRHTYVSRMVNAGIPIKTAQMLARHSDSRLTLAVYSHLELVDQQKAINSLPSLNDSSSRTEPMKAVKTGTGYDVDTHVDTQGSLTDFSVQSMTQMDDKACDSKANKIILLCFDLRGVSSSGGNRERTSLGGFEPPSPP
ncbi:MAG: tyrosine-type recombinase/integrase [bacterium]